MKAIITGGNRGIGFEVAKRLVARGFEVHVLSRSGLETPPAGITAWKVDVADYESLKAVLDQIGVPDVFVNNAGIMNTRAAADYGREHIQEILDINLISAVRASVDLADRMAAVGGGRIVSVASVAGQIGHPDIWYGISKAGLINAMRSIARSHGARGVIANSVAPGPVDTDMMKSIPEARKARLKSATISQRFCSAEEVADAILWLATDAPVYINGEVVDMNNGVNYR
ncbi:SDR family NAD(P)-dependent oxidoreductase [Niveibacterium terrae]|uniref:SDR family NAD(P)-dependent oxidoreductase n=1 Tax=Niveibacterium terrae TaxID=3373598 RepID=UPI003A94263D